MTAHAASKTICQPFSVLRRLVPAQTPCVVLRLGAVQSSWMWGTGNEVEHEATLTIGIETLAQRFFHNHRPNEATVERAIEVVEDMVMPWRRVLPPHAALVSADAYVAGWLQQHGATRDNGTLLRTATVEAMFNQWVDAALGGGARKPSQPTSGTVPATLLVVREVLHHLGFEGIHVPDGVLAQAE